MKEYKFKGLDNGANIKSGIIVAIIITVVTAIGFYFFNEKIKTYLSAIFFITSHALVGIIIFLIFIARHLNGRWGTKLHENYIEFFYNEKLKKSIFCLYQSIGYKLSQFTIDLELRPKANQTVKLGSESRIFLSKLVTMGVIAI